MGEPGESEVKNAHDVAKVWEEFRVRREKSEILGRRAKDDIKRLVTIETVKDDHVQDNLPCRRCSDGHGWA